MQDLVVIPRTELESIIKESVVAAINVAIPQKKDPYPHLPEFLTRKQTAKALGLSLTTIDNLARQGRLQKRRNGKITRFSKKDVIEFGENYKRYERT